MSNPMRIVFMGTPGFAVENLRVLNESHHEVVAVITAPDRPAGRGRKLRAPEVKEYAVQHSLPVLQPEKLRNPKFLEDLASYKADLFVVVAFRMLPELVWSMPEKGTINLHASLLPQYRGAAPINWAIINGETKSGATTFFINEEIDKGKTIDSIEVEINPNDDAGDLHDRLMILGAQHLLKTVDLIAEGKAVAKEQVGDAVELKKAPKLNSENRSIDWNRSAKEIYDLIRGLSPYPSALSTLSSSDEDDITCKIFRSKVLESSDLGSGETESDKKSYLKVGTGSHDLEILEIQLSGKKKMGIKDLLNGFDWPQKALFKLSYKS